ncbi:hypothetical protein V5799_023518 [Amblyomma americanum]|uniref:Uncharacterized protein n=1 Tax=Amblyomma americanum TaxID=6943 RepID=A0AAQ4FHD3_AMBAM
MIPKRYRTAVTIGVIGAMSCVGTVLFSLSVSRGRHRSSPSPASCNSTTCQTEVSRQDAPGSECRGFYDYVCARHRHLRPLPHHEAALALATHLNASITGFPSLPEALLRGSCPGHYALLGLDLYRACMGQGAEWDQVSSLLQQLGLAGWPMTRAQPLDRAPWDLAGMLDLRLGVFPIARLSLRRHYGRVTLQLDRTPLPLRLHQLALPLRDLNSYVRTVERALGLLQPAGGEEPWGAAAAAIVELEQALERAQPRDAFVYGPRLIRLGDLPRSRHWKWAEYVAVVRDDSSLLSQANLTVLVHEPEQLALATELLGNASAAVVFNYLGYRTIVHLAPLLPAGAHFLLPLAPWADVAPPRLAGCLRLLAHVHPFALRFFAALEPGQQNVQAKPEDRADRLFVAAQRATAAVVEALPWREKGIGLRRARPLLEARLERGQSSQAERATAPQCKALWTSKGGVLESLLRVQSARPNAFWLAASPDDGLDSRHQVEPFSMRADYFREPNVVYASPALLTALRELEEVQAAAPLVEALLRAALPGEPQELLRVPPSQMRCLARRLGTSQYDSHMPDRLRELIQPSALLALYERSTPPADLGHYSARQFFFVHWAMTLCDAPQLQKRLRRFKVVPTRLRVDVTLANYAAFHEAWRCPSGSAMHRNKACPPLTR